MTNNQFGDPSAKVFKNRTLFYYFGIDAAAVGNISRTNEKRSVYLYTRKYLYDLYSEFTN